MHHDKLGTRPTGKTNKRLALQGHIGLSPIKKLIRTVSGRFKHPTKKGRYAIEFKDTPILKAMMSPKKAPYEPNKLHVLVNAMTNWQRHQFSKDAGKLRKEEPKDLNKKLLKLAETHLRRIRVYG